MVSIRWAVSAISFHVECGHNFNLQVDVLAVQVYSSKHQQHVSFNGFSNIRYTPATTYIFHTVSSSNQELIKYTTKCTSKTQQSQLICQVQETRSSIYTAHIQFNKQHIYSSYNGLIINMKIFADNSRKTPRTILSQFNAYRKLTAPMQHAAVQGL